MWKWRMNVCEGSCRASDSRLSGVWRCEPRRQGAFQSQGKTPWGRGGRGCSAARSQRAGSLREFFSRWRLRRQNFPGTRISEPCSQARTSSLFVVRYLRHPGPLPVPTAAPRKSPRTSLNRAKDWDRELTSGVNHEKSKDSRWRPEALCGVRIYSEQQ